MAQCNDLHAVLLKAWVRTARIKNAHGFPGSLSDVSAQGALKDSTLALLASLKRSTIPTPLTLARSQHASISGLDPTSTPLPVLVYNHSALRSFQPPKIRQRLALIRAARAIETERKTTKREADYQRFDVETPDVRVVARPTFLSSPPSFTPPSCYCGDDRFSNDNYNWHAQMTSNASAFA